MDTISNNSNDDNMGRLAHQLKTCIVNEKTRVARARQLVRNLSQEERMAVTRHRLNDGSTLLCQAVMANRRSYVTFLLDECYADVDQPSDVYGNGSRYETPLCSAVIYSDMHVVRILVEHGADVNAAPGTQHTPLYWACVGPATLVEYLVENGADVNIADMYGETCLMRAQHNYKHCGKLKGIQCLVDHGASVTAVDNAGNTALHHTLQRGVDSDKDVVSLHLRLGADLSTPDRFGDDALQAAALNGCPEILDLLIAELQPTQQRRADLYALTGAQLVDKDHSLTGWYALLGAQLPINNDHSLTVTLWEKSLSYRTQTPQDGPRAGPHPTFNGAVEFHDINSLEALSDNEDALFMQALVCRERILGSGHRETVYCLSDRAMYYAERPNTYERGINMYKYAAASCNAMSVYWGRDVDVHRKWCMLLWNRYRKDAASVRFDDAAAVVRMLIPANLQCKVNSYPMVPFTLEMILQLSIHAIELMCLLMSSEAEFGTMQQLVRELVLSRCVSAGGRKLLHLAVRHDSFLFLFHPEFYHPLPSIAVVEELLEAGAVVNAMDSKGNTPLHLAVKNPPPDAPRRDAWLEVVDLLVRHGAHIDVRNAEGETAADGLPSTIDKTQSITLQCLAARAVIRHGIEYRNILSQMLADFVALH